MTKSLIFGAILALATLPAFACDPYTSLFACTPSTDYGYEAESYQDQLADQQADLQAQHEYEMSTQPEDSHVSNEDFLLGYCMMEGSRSHSTCSNR